MPVEKSILDDALSSYLHSLVNSLQHKQSMPILFPPKDLQSKELNDLVGSVVVGFLHSNHIISIIRCVLVFLQLCDCITGVCWCTDGD